MNPQPIQPDEELDLQDLLRVALSHSLFIAVFTLAVTGLAAAYAFLWPPTYEASTTVKVPDNSLTPSGMLKEIVPIGGDPVETYVEVAQSESVMNRVVEGLGLVTRDEYARFTTRQELLEKLSRKVKVANIKKSNVISITAQSHDPLLAAGLANEWAKAFIAVNLDLSHKGAESKRLFLEEQARQLKTRLNDPKLRLNEESKADEVMYAQLLSNLQEAKLAENVDDAGIVMVDAASIPEKPVAPKKGRTLVLAFLLGLALGVQLAFLLDRIRDRVKHEDTLKAISGLPNYAVIPDYREDYPPGLSPPDPKERFSIKVLVSNPVFTHAFYKESFKVLRTNLTLARADRPLKAMAVLSPGPEEGKTLVNANLAISLAETGKRTLLVDADFRKSSLRKIFGLESRTETGLPLALTGQKPWAQMVRPSGVENLFLLPNSVAPPNPAELLGSATMRKLIEEMKDEYEYVVFDGAPVLPVTDSVVLATHLDGVVLLTRWDKTKTRETVRALEHLKGVGAKVLGTLLNYVRMKKGLYGYGGYGYGYGNYRYAPEEQSEKADKS